MECFAQFLDYSSKETPVKIPCEIKRVVIDENSPNQTVVVAEKGGERQLPILIGIPEALALNRAVNGERTLRPMTHSLTVNTIAALGGKVERLDIHDLRQLEGSDGGTFIGRLTLARNGETKELDCRPSDGLILCTLAGAPIFIEDTVFEKSERSAGPAILILQCDKCGKKLNAVCVKCGGPLLCRQVAAGTIVICPKCADICDSAKCPGCGQSGKLG